MNNDELTALLVGIAKAQAAMLEGMASKLDQGKAIELRISVQQSVANVTGNGPNKPPITLETLPALLLTAALAPTSHAGRTIHQTAQEAVGRLLK